MFCVLDSVCEEFWSSLERFDPAWKIGVTELSIAEPDAQQQLNFCLLESGQVPGSYVLRGRRGTETVVCSDGQVTNSSRHWQKVDVPCAKVSDMVLQNAKLARTWRFGTACAKEC